jgi:pantoate--beta-alanine ligase
MKVAETVQQLNDVLQHPRAAKQSIGFVPTMGALHEGHLSLVRQCKSRNDVTVVSIFVNPTQFNDKNDLKNYPRMPERDTAMLREAGCDVVFMPGEQEMYPEPDTRQFDFGALARVMEGVHRPGHFNGVAQVVTRLFDMVKPQRAYFGQKDFQQLAIIRKVVRDQQLPVEVVACAIVREPDGLAMSSRNMLLSPEQRAHAVLISQTLFRAREMAGARSVEEVKQYVTETLNADPYLDTEYFEICNDTTLQPVHSWKDEGGKTGCVAVRVGTIRLIDNVSFSS